MDDLIYISIGIIGNRLRGRGASPSVSLGASVSADVLQFKQKPVKGTVKRQAPDGTRFYCLACDGDAFYVMGDMRVVCATGGCWSFIRNLKVYE